MAVYNGTMTENLQSFRRQASEHSDGKSADYIYKLFLRLIESVPASESLLDYGAGRGDLSKAILATGRIQNIYAADLFPPPADLPAGIQWLQKDLNEELDQYRDRFDILVSAEVIEHLENPRATMRSWFQMLKPGGRLFFSTPNNESYRALLSLFFRGHFIEFTDSCYPAHITALLRKDLERITREAGFMDWQFHYTDHGSVPKLTNLTWQQISGGLLRGRRFSDNIAVSCRKPS